VEAILRGEKTATTGLLAEYQHEGPLPGVGERFLLIDELDRAVGVIETTEICLTTVSQVDLQFALDEGEGFTSVAEWRVAHENFFNSYAAEVAAWTGDPDWHLTDDTEIVCERFRLVERLPIGP
jgi:uncharacterized protein YhfF